MCAGTFTNSELTLPNSETALIADVCAVLVIALTDNGFAGKCTDLEPALPNLETPLILSADERSVSLSVSGTLTSTVQPVGHTGTPKPTLVWAAPLA
jgi:hypothetical protein